MTTITGGSPNNFDTPLTPSTPNPAVQKELTGSAKDRATIGETYDQFLLLLTTQLKNQDPLSPMDSTEFTNQLVSFSQVEQQIKTNDNLTKLVNQANLSATTLGLSFIGLNVNISSGQFEYPGSGSTITSYTLPANAATTRISVVDDTGNVVYSQAGETTAGQHNFTWNGKDNNGQVMPAGTYRLLVGAQGADGKSVSVSTLVPGFVRGITTADDGTINLVIGHDKTQIIPLSSVTQASL
jgi:flagellar basal-body rod modification protein FlgD